MKITELIARGGREPGAHKLHHLVNRATTAAGPSRARGANAHRWNSLATDNDARAHLYSTGHDALPPLKARRRSVFWQRVHSNFWYSYPAAFIPESCSIRAMRISEPHEMHGMANACC